MSRRNRQLFFQQAALRSWQTVKADVKATFLQTAPTQLCRAIPAKPVPELARAMGVPEGEAVQIAKACYGLINAPAEWFRDIGRTLKGLGMKQLRTEPCFWRFVKWKGGKPVLVGLILAHVDDFGSLETRAMKIGWPSTAATHGHLGKLSHTTIAVSLCVKSHKPDLGSSGLYMSWEES